LAGVDGAGPEVVEDGQGPAWLPIAASQLMELSKRDAGVADRFIAGPEEAV